MFPYRWEIDLRIGPLAVGGGEGTRHARDRDHRDAGILGLAAGVNRAVAADGDERAVTRIVALRNAHDADALAY